MQSGIKQRDIKLIDDEVVNDIRDRVYTIYKKNGGNGRVAKSADFINHIEKLFNDDLT